MVEAPQRTALSGPTLIRLLARLTDADVPDDRQSLADRLSQWLSWTDAITLSSALNGNPPVVRSDARANARAAENECARVRASLTNAVTDDSVFAALRQRGPAHAPLPGSSADVSVDYSVFRQRYLFMQREMETAVGNLRERLRVALAARTPEMARLAMVDAVMERALAPREQSLLAGIPALLAKYFERLRQAEQGEHAELADAEAAGVVHEHAPQAWLDRFRKDMQSALLAEMEVRFQPVEGLLAALRTR
jgi:hypothetical protein